MARLDIILQASSSVLLEAYLATLNTCQVVLLAYLAGQAKASGDERERRKRNEAE